MNNIFGKRKMLANKKAQSTGFAWIFGLVSLFGLGVMYIVFNQVFMSHLVPIIKDQVDIGPADAATKLEVSAGIDRYMAYFHALPYILFFVVVIYMIVVAVRKERESQFQ